ncbi:hypothetical protein Tco_0374428, partial [Tanacetum coccineum]
MTAHYNDWDTSAHRGESSCSTTSSSSEIATLTQQMSEMIKDILQMYRSNQQFNFVTSSCEICGGPHSYYECQTAGGYTQDVYATMGNYNLGAQSNYQSTDDMLRNFIISSDSKIQTLTNQMDEMRKVLQERPQGALPSNTIPNPREEIKVTTTRSGITLAGHFVLPPPPSFSPKEVERDPEPTMDQLPKRNPHQPPIPYPLRLNKDKLQDKPDIQIHKFLQMFKKLHINISLAEALALIPKYTKVLKDLLSNKEKLLELANTPLTENCSAVLLKKLPKKLRDPRK